MAATVAIMHLPGFDASQASRTMAAAIRHAELAEDTIRSYTTASRTMAAAIRHAELAEDTIRSYTTASRTMAAAIRHAELAEDTIRSYTTASRTMAAAIRHAELAEDTIRSYTTASRTMAAAIRHAELAEDTIRSYTTPSRTMEAPPNDVRFQCLGPGEDAVPAWPATGCEDAANGAADTTAEMLEVLETLVELETWIRLAALLGRLREAGLEGLDAARLAVASRIDECLGRLVVAAGSGGSCWGCGVPALTPCGAACLKCAVLVGTMVLEMWLLVEGL